MLFSRLRSPWLLGQRLLSQSLLNQSLLSLNLLNQSLLSQCLLCHDAVAGQQPLCCACEQALPYNRPCCARCANPMPVAVPHCAECLQHPPHFAQANASFHYDEQIRYLLNRYKHQRDLACGHWLAHLSSQQLQQAIADNQLQRPDWLLPVPLNRKRLRQRGFNQATEIARVYSKALGIPLLGGLARHQPTPPLQHLSRAGRASAVRHAFQLRNPPPTAHIALVDDVLTTGATANEISRLLYACGVTRVDVWTLARVPDHAPPLPRGR